VGAGGTIELVTPGGTAHYVGNWSVGTPGTSASAPVTIEAAPGLASQPVLDGNDGASSGCSTASCAGPVLSVPGGEYMALAAITIADANNTSTFTGGGLDNSGSVTITGSTFTGNTTSGGGGAIDNGDGFNGRPGTGTVTVTGSTFTGNSASGGGAIDSGRTGGGSVTVTASTFTGNTALDGGAIDSADLRGGGSVTVTDSTFTGNTAGEGGAIDNGDEFGGGSVQVAGDVFADSCHRPGGSWGDGGYNAGGDGSCFNAGPGDVNAGSAAALGLGPLAGNGGPTQTIAPQPVTPATVIGIIPGTTTVSLGGRQVTLCPATDQRGYATATSSACDAGAVQTAGSPPVLALKDSATPGSFNQAGQVITYSYKVTNTGAGALTGIAVTDPAVPGVSCPASLPPGTSVICTGSYITTSADLAAGKITDTATASAAATNGVPVASATATVTVHQGWPPVVTGVYRPSASAAEGYYLGVNGSTWSLFVTPPDTGKLAYTGTVTLNAGAFTSLTRVHLGPNDSAQISHKTLTFHLTDTAAVKGIRFATTAPATSITFTLDIGGAPANGIQLYLGGLSTPAGAAGFSGSPVTFTR
jgi:uncharacterized repeat protein (TIGR01451 family)